LPKNEKESLRVIFDQAHGNSLTIESPAFNTFISLFFERGFSVGKITRQLNYKILMDLFQFKEGEIHKNNLLVLGNPQNSTYSMDEIYSILEFVKNGGNILIITDEGGDLSSKTNLSEGFGAHFGFKILNNIIFDQKYNVNGKVIWPIVSKFEDHPITIDLNSIVYASGCSFELLKSNDFAEFLDVKIKPIILSNDSCEMKYYDVYLHQWKEEYAKDAILMLVGQFFEGRFAIIGTPSIFSNLSDSYGIRAKDNFRLTENLIEWLIGKREPALGVDIFGDKVEVQLRIEKELFRWANSEKILKYFGDFSYLINYALKRLKKSFEDHNFDLERDKPRYI